MVTKRLFSDWNKEELEETFALNRLETHATLEQWFQTSGAVTIEEVEQVILDRLRKTLLNHTNAWNEIELSEYFISPVMALVDFPPLFYHFFRTHFDWHRRKL